MCKIFLPNLGLIAIKGILARFVMCSRTSKPFASLLSLAMKEGKTLKAYSDRYWELYNEIEGR